MMVLKNSAHCFICSISDSHLGISSSSFQQLPLVHGGLFEDSSGCPKGHKPSALCCFILNIYAMTSELMKHTYYARKLNTHFPLSQISSQYKAQLLTTNCSFFLIKNVQIFILHCAFFSLYLSCQHHYFCTLRPFSLKTKKGGSKRDLIISTLAL